MLLTLRLLLLARTAMLMSMSESINLLKCVNVNEIVMFPDDSDECCGEGEWMILTKAGDYRCDAETKCEDQNNVMYDGVCRDVFEDGVCGPEALGERLYLGEDGLGYCDCAEGWVRHEGRCYQEFTPAFCPTVGEILKGSFQQKSYLQPNRAKVSYSCERLAVLTF